jgi:cytoskeletal protein RodZ
MKESAFPGCELRSRREELGLTPDDVYRRLRIPSEYIVAIEDGQWGMIPAATYSIGFIKSYAAFLGLDPHPYVDSYRECTRRVAPRIFNLSREQDWVAPRWLQEAMAWGTVCALLVLGWFTYSAVLKPTPESQDRVEAGTLDTRDGEPVTELRF